MKVILAKNAGFCMGVRRAVETTLEMVRQDGEGIATLGPLIHNPQVLDLLGERGVQILSDIPETSQGTIIIRAHGVPPESKARLEASGAKVKDATCPRVLKVQAIIKKHHQQGYATVIIGDRNHAEVEGLLGFAEGTGVVISNDEEARNIHLTSPYIVVSQTTQDNESFTRMSQLILDRVPEGKVFNTICDSTHKRQDAVLTLCDQVQAMVVVGGKNSANTKRLGEIVKKKGCPVYFVETEDDLDLMAFSQYDTVGVTAGASTPSWMINRVVRSLESIPGQDEGFLFSLLYQVQRFLLASNLYVSVGGGFLACVTMGLMGRSFGSVVFMVVFGYLLAMHNINRFKVPGGGFSDPSRDRFRRKYGWILCGGSIVFLINSFHLAATHNEYSILLLALLSTMGILYTVRIIPRAVSGIIKVRRLKEIPGSKTLFVSMAWAVVIVLVPTYHSTPPLAKGTLGAAFLMVFLVTYIRSALFDVFEVQGDRIVGKETLPVFLGQEKTLNILYTLIGFLLSLLIAGPLLGLLTPLAYWLIPAVVYLFLIMYLYQRGKVNNGLRLEFALDSLYLIAAVMVGIGSFVD
ncbi:MAG: 4-hydroxy-3-methylbut-2-enyl diphosphate reductase [Proteobacteria bacterium]|nr:4-hydroxy-3-methylbut-2-enyl diphosphate reductase [Pseudomonadota bacterium]MBU1686434.1 4-hydroxy-3-methylbut-2-enyl diphosphate reductase [Pseudomonadota bacterium]